MRRARSAARVAFHSIGIAALIAGSPPARAEYVNFESSQVHPIALTPGGGRLLAVNTPDALLEVFTVGPGGLLTPERSIRVGLEPVSVRPLDDGTAWVVNHLSDTVSVVDLAAGAVVRTLPAGDEPNDVVFAGGRAFVAVGAEDAVKVFDLAHLDQPPVPVALFGSYPRALAVSKGGDRVYAVVQNSGNQTTVVNANIAFGNNAGQNAQRLQGLGLNPMTCRTAPPAYPPLPAGITRDQQLIDPPDGIPKVGLIVKWEQASGRWKDEAGSDWTDCLPFRLPDHDLFAINVTGTPGVAEQVDHLGTTLFEVSVNPGNGRIYVPNTEARNTVRFEHPLGVQGHMVDDRLTVVDPGQGNAVTPVDLNTHIDRHSDPAANLAERRASISQPGMMVWNAAGTTGYLTAIGSRKLFRVDGACLSGACIFGPSRAAPAAVEVGEGPTGVALSEALGRLYVLDRFSNSIAVVDASTLTKTGDVALHDPTPPNTRNGRRFLYDGIDTSGHGDAACSSCHISGDKDGLAWDLGNPEGMFARYGTAGDNVRFIAPSNGQPTECDPAACASHKGFDPQKGPMSTQTLRGMLEPLHWRGDRGTMNAFNKAFVGLMGTADIGPINNEPAGLSAADMELYRQFALNMNLPPNPFRAADDTIPDAVVSVPTNPFAGNPANGQRLFLTGQTDGGQPCVACHALPFGAAGGKLGGINPGDPRTALAGLFNGTLDGSRHSDLKVPHTRNMYTKLGPVFGTFDSPPERKSGFGFIHDGSIPDLGTFLSAGVFILTPQQAADLTVFLNMFPTNIRPSVGQNLTVPAGPPPTGPPPAETLLSTLIRVGNLADQSRHCELTAVAPVGGRVRGYALEGGIGTGGLWTTDVPGEMQVSTATLRQNATGPVTFLCATLGSGRRLGVDRDEDLHLDGADCNAADAGAFAAPVEVPRLGVDGGASTKLTWDDQAPQTGSGIAYDVAGGSLLALRAGGLQAATGCVAANVPTPGWTDDRAAPPAGDGFFYLVRAGNSCGDGGFGPGGPIDALACPAP